MYLALNRLVATFVPQALLPAQAVLGVLPEPQKAHAVHVLNGVARRGGVIMREELDQLRTRGHSPSQLRGGLGQLLSAGLMDVGVGGNSFHLTPVGGRCAAA